jgi:hypothetical protein
VFSTKIVDQGGHRGNGMQALTRWLHPVASIEARDVLHWVMRLVSYRHFCMAVEIASNSPAFFVVLIRCLPLP